MIIKILGDSTGIKEKIIYLKELLKLLQYYFLSNKTRIK